MSKCIKCGQFFETTSTTGRPSDYCSSACRRAAGYEVERINKRLADLENDLVREKLHKDKNDRDAYGKKCQERIEALEAAILESEARLKSLLAAKND